MPKPRRIILLGNSVNKKTNIQRGELSFRHLIEAGQIGKSDIEKLISLAEKYRSADAKKVLNDGNCRGYILASLFFEASTRTRFSFETAMLKLGGQITTLEQASSSSATKGESLADTARIISSYADMIVMRHPTIESVSEFAKYSSVPVINAGDGANQHPTQSLVDMYTIFCEKKRLNNFKIGLLGDLKYGRAPRSLLTVLNKYSNNHFVLISHPSLAVGKEKIQELKNSKSTFEETTDLKSVINSLDILYVTRVQKERFENESEYNKVKNLYQINKKSLAKVKSNMIIMHPLPRVNEIDTDVDNLPYAKYFKQAEYGLYIRMALLSLIKK